MNTTEKCLYGYRIGPDANLQGANLQGANLQEADLRGADLRGASLRGADLQGANLQEADLRGAGLRGADLRGADLRGADLRGADLRGADLRGADLRGADLQGADLREADLWGANLWGASLQGTCLDPDALPNADVSSFEVVDGYVIGYRTRLAGHIDQYRDGRNYSADWFSVADTECHPGLYLWPTLVCAKEYSGDTEFIQVRTKAEHVHRAVGKWRCREFYVVGAVK